MVVSPELSSLLIYMLLTKNCQVRDYIHVVDLADGHIAALRKLYEDSDKIGWLPIVDSKLHGQLSCCIFKRSAKAG
jgi:hypothetical protein